MQSVCQCLTVRVHPACAVALQKAVRPEAVPLAALEQFFVVVFWNGSKKYIWWQNLETFCEAALASPKKSLQIGATE